MNDNEKIMLHNSAF